MRWLLFAALGFLFWPSLWRVELTDSAVVRINRLTGAIDVTPLPNASEFEIPEERYEDESQSNSSCPAGAEDDDQDENLPKTTMSQASSGRTISGLLGPNTAQPM